MTRPPAGETFTDQVRRTVVAVYSRGRHRGSGFFCQPGLVVTCAHVVWQCPDDVELAWNGERLPGRVLVRDPPDRGNGEVYAFPDLSFIRMLDDVDHPYAAFPETPETVERLTIAARTRSLVSAEPAAESAAVEVVGLIGDYMKVKGDEITPGMSGAPAFDPRRGRVHGVVKASRDERAPRGGVLIAAAHVQRALVQHRQALRLPSVPDRAVLRPGSDDLRSLLRAVSRAADRMPYGIVDGVAPAMSGIYVRLYARDKRDARRHTVPPEEMVTAHRHVVLSGVAGSGKTTLLNQIAGTIAESWIMGDPAQDSPFGGVVALRLPARALTGDRPLSVALSAALNADLGEFLDRAIEPALFDQEPMPGVDWLLLVDGLDEVFNIDRRHRLLSMLSHRLGEYGQRFRFLIASRPLPSDEVAMLRSRIAEHADTRLGEYEIAPFNRAALREFGRRWFAVRSPADAATKTGRFLDEVTGGPLAPLIRTPLLATIAAVVFETYPDSALPVDRTGLYRRFLDYLLYIKGRQLDVRADFLEQLSRHGRTGVLVAESLVEEVERCLEVLGVQRVVGQETPTVQAAIRWLRRRLGDIRGIPDLERYVRMLLSSTGVLHLANDDFEFRHQSIAEYLAAGHLAANGFSPGRYVQDLRAGGLTSLAAFTLARWVHAGHDAFPVLRHLHRPGLTRRYPDLHLLVAIMRDGVRLGPRSEPGLARMVVNALRHRLVLDDDDADAFATVLHALRARTDCDDLVLELATDRRISALKRIASAVALMHDGRPDHREAAIDAVREVATTRSYPLEDRLPAMWALVVGDLGADRRWALEALLDAAIRLSPAAAGARALVLLIELGEGEALSVALLARAVDGITTVADRSTALDTLAVVLDELKWAGRPAGARYTRRHSHLPPIRLHPWDSGDDLAYRMLVNVDIGLVERLPAALALTWPMAPASVERLLEVLMLDPGFGWAARAHMAVDVIDLGLARPGRDALRTLATDTYLSAQARVAVVLLLGARHGEPDSQLLLSQWSEDLAGDPRLRLNAVMATARWDPPAAPARAEAYVNDPAAPFTWRLQIAAAADRHSAGDGRRMLSELRRGAGGAWHRRLAVATVAWIVRLERRFGGGDRRARGA
ncbi:trypsin-like peptidase domain-containing protein [Dactylosporangium sucinum]|uniref:NACHT domain-containing protein n=1 Tax=Dactylosporangium sucinum TaxID=1424081 RepID=A0A917TMU4_9ACTN|nr:trypsin-like peptidase domain-containing protein [Dactylosporangium sucinum]GGM26717.1 hypothetical protein GCM10007977_029810 [Dactylosporangium sucinum]